ncbi:hypothetical protein ABKA04_004023 [Annulohypoxylon sp. FPYF3050]
MSTNNIFVNDEYEHDDRWTAVDAYAISHLHPDTCSITGVLARTLENIRDAGMPDDSTYPAFGKYLALQVRSAGAKDVLKVSTLGGYTAIWIASPNPDTRITMLEVDPKHAAVARQSLELAGVADRVEVLDGIGFTNKPLRSCVYPSYNIDDDPDKPAVLMCIYTWIQGALRMVSLVMGGSPKRGHSS